MPAVLTPAGVNPVETMLSTVASSAVQREGIYIGAQISAHVDVDPTDFDGKLWLENDRPFNGQRFVSLRRAAGVEFPLVASGDPNTIDYLCEERSGKSFISSKLIQRSTYPDELSEREMGIIRRALLDDLEREASGLAFAAGNWAANTATVVGLVGGSGVQFGLAGADEIGDLGLVIENVRSTSNGHNPNAMAIGISAWNRLKTATSFRNFIGDDRNRTRLSDAELRTELMSSLALEFLYVGQAVSETTSPDIASAVVDLWTDNVLLYHKTEGGAVEMDGGARVGINTFMRVRERLDVAGAPVEGANGVALGGSKWESKDPPGIWAAAAHSYDLLQISSAFGFLLTDCVA